MVTCILFLNQRRNWKLEDCHFEFVFVFMLKKKQCKILAHKDKKNKTSDSLIYKMICFSDDGINHWSYWLLLVYISSSVSQVVTCHKGSEYVHCKVFRCFVFLRHNPVSISHTHKNRKMYVLRSVIESRKPELVSKWTIKLTHAKSTLALGHHFLHFIQSAQLQRVQTLAFLLSLHL